MGTFTRAKNTRQQRHPASRGKSHIKDKTDAERRQGAVFVRVPTPVRPSPERDFQSYGLTGHEFTFDGDKWHRCAAPEEFADHLEHEGARRSWFIGKAQRSGKTVKMKRPVATPLEVLTTSFSPWLSDWMLHEFQAGRDPRPKLAQIRNRWAEQARARLQPQRYILGLAFHGDTSDPHFDICTSRQDGNGGRIGKAGLLLVGPWCVGTDRQIRAKADISTRKKTQLQKSVENFRHRYGQTTVPLDIQLARDFDQIADDEIGAELNQFREAYAARVPGLERAHEAAELEALDAAREKLAPTPTPATEPEQQTEPEPNIEPLPPIRRPPPPGLSI